MLHGEDKKREARATNCKSKLRQRTGCDQTDKSMARNVFLNNNRIPAGRWSRVRSAELQGRSRTYTQTHERLVPHEVGEVRENKFLDR